MFRGIVAALCLAMTSASTTAIAQSPEERAQVMNRVVDGLNSPDPVTRLVTLETAMASGDRNVQRIALSAAFNSSDVALRSAATEAAFAIKSSFIVEFTGFGRGNDADNWWRWSGGSIEVRIGNFDKATGDFLSFSPVSYKDESGYRAGKGNLSGDRVSFDVDMGQLASGQCIGSVSAKPGETLMVGTMNCGGLGYTIKVDLLR